MGIEWYNRSPTNEIEVWQSAVDPKTNLFVHSPVLCDEKKHANEYLVVTGVDPEGPKTCHYKGCGSAITVVEVDETARAFLERYLNSAVRVSYKYHQYNYEQLKTRVDGQIRILTALKKKTNAIQKAIDAAPEVETIRMRRVLRRERAEQLRAQRKACKKTAQFLLVFFGTIFVIYQLIIFVIQAKLQERQLLQDDVCRAREF